MSANAKVLKCVKKHSIKKDSDYYEIWFVGASGLPMRVYNYEGFAEGTALSVSIEPDRFCNARVVIEKA